MQQIEVKQLELQLRFQIEFPSNLKDNVDPDLYLYLHVQKLVVIEPNLLPA